MNIRIKHFIFLFVTTIFFTLFPRCTDDNTVTSSMPVRETIEIISGNNQTGTGGEELDEPVIIKISDQYGNPLSGVIVNFNIVEGNGELITLSPNIASDQNGLIESGWIIGSSYNAMELTMTNSHSEVDPVYIFAEGENPTGLNRTRTLTSIVKHADALFEITFYGDYSALMDQINQDIVNGYGGTGNFNRISFNCSVFATYADPGNILFGRSFDNPYSFGRCTTMLCRFNPPDGYSSLIPVRTQDMGELYIPGNDLSTMPLALRQNLVYAPFCSPDGINEMGVVVALADISSRGYTPDPGKEYLFKTRFITEILDHAANVDEAAQIALNHNLFDYGLNVFSTHALVADAAGRSILIELAEGEIKIIHNTESFHVATNSPLYNVSTEQAKAQCSRYNYIYNRLSYLEGNMTVQQGMDILAVVGHEFTQWSIVYDISNLALDLALDFNFNQLYHFEFE
ncbi:linear amide C-N hydrolase [Bacteroidota bacterium]